jgi:hypothetical protein
MKPIPNIMAHNTAIKILRRVAIVRLFMTTILILYFSKFDPTSIFAALA